MADSEDNAAKQPTAGKEEAVDEEEEEEEHQQLRDVSESSNAGDAIAGTTAIGPDDEYDQGGLLETNVLNVANDNRSGSTVALTSSTPNRLPQVRVTRFLYFYFMLGFFLILFICIIWGFIGISYLFVGWPGVGLAYFGGLFIPSLWAASLLILDFVVWTKNRDQPARPLIINLSLCCNKIQIRNGRDMTQGWFFILFLYIWFGILLGLPAGSWWLPVAVVPLSITVMTIIADWQYYYMKGDYNGLYGTHRNPWRYIVFTSTLQFIVSVIILLGHFLGHWRCIYEPESLSDSEHLNICHDWVPYELTAVVYGLLLFMYFYKKFEGDELDSNTLPKAVRYYLWFQSLLLLVAIIWMIIEIFDGHVYIYDVVGFIYLWFVAPVFIVISRSFRIR